MASSTQLAINNLPKEKLPEFWNDSARINALYAPFRDRSVNPRDWESKLNFWKNIICTWCEHNKICTFSESDLKQFFVQNGRVPACLGIVMNEIYRNGEIQNINDFMEVPQKSWSGWALDIVVKKPLKWSLSKVVNVVMSPVQPDSKFVHVPTVKKLSDELFSSISQESRNKLLSVDELNKIDILKNANSDTIDLLLHYLQCQNKIAVLKDYDNGNNLNKRVTLIKFAENNNKVSPITDVDLGKYTLEQNEKLLIEKIESLEQTKNEINEAVRMYLRKGMKQLARTNLRKQHELERRIEKQASVLCNVQELLGRIGSAESDGEVLDSYRHGLNALKRVFAKGGLDEDLAQDTMLELSEVLETHEDIQTTLSQSVSSTLDAELEEELAELLAQPAEPEIHTPPDDGEAEQDFKSLEQRLLELKLPAVVTKTPSPSPIKSPVNLI